MAATIKTKTKTGKCVSKDTEKLESFYTISGNVKWCSCYGKQYDSFSKKLKTDSVLGTYSIKSSVKETFVPSCSLQHSLYSSRKVEITKCPLTDEWIKKMWYRHTMEYYSALNRKEILICYNMADP